MIPALCSYYDRCGLSDPAANCAQADPTAEGLCTTDNLVKEDAGIILFAPTVAQACLDSMSDAGCDGSSLVALATRCGPTYLLLPNSPLNGSCDANSDCLPIDAGPIAFGQSGPGCSINEQSLTCSGFCTSGSLLGEPCGNLSIGCAPGQGTCTFDESLLDGGSGAYCNPYVADGGTCADVTYPANCDGLTEYCADAGVATLICQPVAAPGSPCDPTACAAAPAQCPCGPLACAVTTDVNTGVCSVVGPQTPCVGDFPGSCGATQNCSTVLELADGGSGAFCYVTVAGLGSACDPDDVCPSPLNCSQVTNTCVEPGLTGSACNLGDSAPCLTGATCLPAPDAGDTFCTPQAALGAPGSPCNFDSSNCELFDYCANVSDGGSACLLQGVVGDPCDSTSSESCGVGACLPASDGGAVCVAYLNQGDPCDPNLATNLCSDGYCAGGALSDGGSYCTEGVCGD